MREREVLNDEDDEEVFPEEDEEDREDEFLEDLFEEMRERARFGN